MTHPPGAPERRLRMGSCEVLLLGTIAGFVPDARRVRDAFATGFADGPPEAVALGIPADDLAGLATLAAARRAGEAQPELPEVDPHTERLFEMLKEWGECRIPSPDLEEAFDLAMAGGAQVEAIDLDDQTHAAEFTKRVGFRHVVLSNALQARLLKKPFPKQADPYALACAWDGRLARLGPFREVERLREKEMAGRLAAMARKHRRILALVPVPRLEGVVAQLEGEASARRGSADA